MRYKTSAEILKKYDELWHEFRCQLAIRPVLEIIPVKGDAPVLDSLFMTIATCCQ